MRRGRKSNNTIKFKALILVLSLAAEGVAIILPMRRMQKGNGLALKSGSRRHFWRSMPCLTILSRNAFSMRT